MTLLQTNRINSNPLCCPKKAGEIDHKVVVVAMMMVMKPYLHLVLEATKSIFNSQPSTSTVVDIFIDKTEKMPNECQ